MTVSFSPNKRWALNPPRLAPPHVPSHPELHSGSAIQFSLLHSYSSPCCIRVILTMTLRVILINLVSPSSLWSNDRRDTLARLRLIDKKLLQHLSQIRDFLQGVHLPIDKGVRKIISFAETYDESWRGFSCECSSCLFSSPSRVKASQQSFKLWLNENYSCSNSLPSCMLQILPRLYNMM